ncbi:endonuclease-reverse transcriptase [Elysia marginata]|uniref:Endonuclease-reverse transcriptase n=1 Tax=Elysia marginata TaxID=1093978 RepID=A0AAV4JN30_9GAST|nr:endonuclease-reverse transcriptase [Elysia marginata]
MEEQLNTLNIKSKVVGLKMHKGKTKFMTNYENDDTIQIENVSIEKVQKYKYLGKSTCMKDLTKEEVDIRIRAGWSCLGRNREIFLDNNMPLCLKKQVYDQCILPTMTYGCQTWSLTKIIGNKLKVAQRAMEREILGIKIKDKIPCKIIRQQTHIKDVVLFAERQEWNWAGHVARMSDNRWTKRATEWQPRIGKRSRGRQPLRWSDSIAKVKGRLWHREAGDRNRWRLDAEGYILQWMDEAS